MELARPSPGETALWGRAAEGEAAGELSGSRPVPGDWLAPGDWPVCCDWPVPGDWALCAMPHPRWLGVAGRAAHRWRLEPAAFRPNAAIMRAVEG